jgi:predicted nuclease of predicted toxin-antitoxin system
VLVTLDKDFADLAMLQGAPPKIIWLRCGNSTVTEVERLLRLNFAEIQRFETSLDASLLEIWP